jgi:hypothetical protein
VALVPGEDPVRVRWPEPYRRAARFEIENLTGADVATLILDLSRNPRPPRELVEAVVEEPAGAACSTMAHPGGQWNLRALVGTPGTVLLRPGAKLTLLVRVEGDPGDSVATVTIPGVTRE